MRLDKFLCEKKIGSRSQVKQLLRQGTVCVNGEVEKKPDRKIREDQDVITYMGNPLIYEKFVYYMLNKPEGVVSAVSDRECRTVTELLHHTGRTDIFPVGRLDKDTEGLLLITNDGALAHQLLSPRKKVEKTYYCELEKDLTAEEICRLEQGVDIGEKKKTLPARVEVLEQKKILLKITEGKFHQVKRMLQAVGNRVLYLKRISMGSLLLDESLKPGEYRPLTDSERKALLQTGKAEASEEKEEVSKAEASEEKAGDGGVTISCNGCVCDTREQEKGIGKDQGAERMDGI